MVFFYQNFVEIVDCWDDWAEGVFEFVGFWEVSLELGFFDCGVCVELVDSAG